MLRIVGRRPLHGNMPVPPDAQIAQHGLVLGALAEGDTRLPRELGAGVHATIRALRSLGVSIDNTGESTIVTGRGLCGWRLPNATVDCGRLPMTLALLSGAIAGQTFGVRLDLASGTLHGPLDHLVGALRARGVPIAAAKNSRGLLVPPLSIAPRLPGELLHPMECELPEPDSNAKAAILLSGLSAAGQTLISEPLISSDHTERMLSAMGVPMRRVGSVAGFDPESWSGALHPLVAPELPGDPALAAVVATVVSAVPESRVALQGVGWNPTRTGFFDALGLLGGRLLAVAKGERCHQPVAELQVRSGVLRGGPMGGEVVARCGEALPALCVLGAHCARGLDLFDADPYARADDRFWPNACALLGAFGVAAETRAAGLIVSPGARLAGREVDAQSDPRLAWVAVLCGMTAEGETRVHHVEGWLEDHGADLAFLRALGAQLEVQS